MLTTDEMIWVLGIFISIFSINLGIWRLVLNDRIGKPNLLAIILNSLLTMVICIGVYKILGNLLIIYFAISIDLIFLLLMINFIKTRDVKGVKFGEKLLDTLHKADIQICFVLYLIEIQETPVVIRGIINQALNYILDEIEGYLRINTIENTIMSIHTVLPEGRFEILSANNLSPDICRELENTLRHGVDPVGISGYVVNSHTAICITDLTNEKDPNIDNWAPIPSMNKREGAIVSFPINRGVGPVVEETMATINISCPKSKAFDCEMVQYILLHFSSKVETLLYCIESLSET